MRNLDKTKWNYYNGQNIFYKLLGHHTNAMAGETQLMAKFFQSNFNAVAL